MLSQEYPVTAVCDIVGLPRSTHYRKSVQRDESDLRQAVEAIAVQFTTYGSRRVAAQLRRQPYCLEVNRKRVQRVMGQMGLTRPTKRRTTVRTTDSRHRFRRYPNLVSGLEITYPEQVWVGDITYIHLRRDFVYLAILMDVFTRSIRGWHLDRSMEGGLTLTALDRALARRTPAIHHSDQGVQYAAHAYVDTLQAAGVAISMAEVGEATQNGYAERVIRTIKEEEVYLSDYRDFSEAYSQIGRFIDEVYQTKRIHSALGYLTPAEFETQWRHQQPNPIGVN